MLTLRDLRGHPERACADLAADQAALFYADGEAEQVCAAASYCHRCPIELECRTWALETGETWGVWGGLTERERRLVRGTRYRRVHCPHCGGVNVAACDEREQICVSCGLSWRWTQDAAAAPAPAA